MPEVRAALADFQRRFARRDGGAVLDGRDIGTVICPEAEVKLYVTASDEVRAHRRWLELQAKGGAQAEAWVLDDLRARDARDSGRATAPLRAAETAVVLDTSDTEHRGRGGTGYRGGKCCPVGPTGSRPLRSVILPCLTGRMRL